ncbi:MAG TPA: hypothetical protein VFT82_01630 [Candidatus Paceibacterota bacterium]|nr:hypothetical protein [Candidatus Paceibacterota bacterium]
MESQRIGGAASARYNGNIMELVKYILDSNIVSVIAGGLVSLLSVYFVEFLKRRKKVENSKLRVYKDIKAALIKHWYYSSFEVQFDILFSYHQRVAEITGDGFHVKEGQRRQLQLEEYQLQTVEIECELEQLAVEYHFHFGRDDEFDTLLRRIRDWQYPPTDYSAIDDIDGLNRMRNVDEDRRHKQMKGSLGKEIADLEKHLDRKVADFF